MISLIQGRAYKIVHPGVDDHKSLGCCSLDVEDPGQQHARVTNDKASGFQQDSDAQILKQRNSRSRVLVDGQTMFRGIFPPDFIAAFERTLIDNSDAAPDAEEFNATLRLQKSHKRQHFFDCLDEWLCFDNL